MKSGMKTHTTMKLNIKLLLQYLETILQIKDLKEHAFVIEVIFQTKMENKAKCNTPQMVATQST